MESKRLELKVGLFVFIGLALLAVLLIQFSKGTSIFHGTYELHLHADNVGGLKRRASVLLAGVPVGSVSDIQLAPSGTNVTIILKIFNSVKIYHDARFVIEQAGFLGDQFVAIIPTKNEPPVLANGAEISCEEPLDFQQVARAATGFIQRIDETAKKIESSVAELQRTVLNGQTLTNFSVAVGNMRSLSDQAVGAVKNIDALVVTNGAQINVAVSNVVFFSQELTRLAGNARGIIATNGAEISVAVTNFAATTEVLKKIADDLQSGKGLAGTVLQNQQLSTNVQVIANNLAVATSNLNRLGLWHFLWHHEPLETNAPPPQKNLTSPRASQQP